MGWKSNVGLLRQGGFEGVSDVGGTSVSGFQNDLGLLSSVVCTMMGVVSLGMGRQGGVYLTAELTEHMYRACE